MLDNFNRININLLLEMGYEVTLASNFSGEEDSSPTSKLQRFREEMEEKGCRIVQIDFSRKIGNLPKQLKSYRQLRALAVEQNYALVHCNSPICAALTRLAFRKNRRTHGTRVIYTAHGFHFFRGAPIRNWLLYFPVEWVCARWTDILNTVNREDYIRAKRCLKAKKIVRLHGVGIDLEKFYSGIIDRAAVRRSLGINKGEKMLLSVGELSRRKNQEAVIRAMAWIMNNTGHLAGPQNKASGSEAPIRLRYVIVGQGEKEADLKALATKLGLGNHTLFLGYREDISTLCQVADLFLLPSLQEGMPMALMEAMAVKTPVICSDIRGNRELVSEKELRFNPKKPKDIADCICKTLMTDQTNAIERHFKILKEYQIGHVKESMEMEYGM